MLAFGRMDGPLERGKLVLALEYGGLPKSGVGQPSDRHHPIVAPAVSGSRPEISGGSCITSGRGR